MKNYLKILGITAGIQIASYLVAVLFAEMPIGLEDSSLIGVKIFLTGYVVSTVVDIVLAVKWGKNIWQRLIYIFLMPTNYLLFLVLTFIMWHMVQWLEVLKSIPPNFG